MDDTSALQGDTLLHTDLDPLNVLINDTARVIDWAWPTCGAAREDRLLLADLARLNTWLGD
ncbi:MAG: hypothetical protein ACRDRD_11660 [Pseudonocardiaceae bacterium]